MTTRAWMSWSSGKDSAYALATLRPDSSQDVVRLLVSTSATTDRVSMHGVRRELVLAQADRLDLPVMFVELPDPCPERQYAAAMSVAMTMAGSDGAEEIVFGDLFRDDVRSYREQALAGTPLQPRFPLWGRDTARLARDMLDAGIRAVITSVDTRQAPGELAGRPWDARLLAELPDDVDPCGEHGEFHTFVWDGPGFAAPVNVETGAAVERDDIVTCDLGLA